MQKRWNSRTSSTRTSDELVGSSADFRGQRASLHDTRTAQQVQVRAEDNKPDNEYPVLVVALVQKLTNEALNPSDVNTGATANTVQCHYRAHCPESLLGFGPFEFEAIAS